MLIIVGLFIGLYFVSFGAGAAVALAYTFGIGTGRTLIWLSGGFGQLLLIWKEKWEFDRLELIEDRVAELQGKPHFLRIPLQAPKRLGCAGSLVFILMIVPWHLTVTPIGLFARGIRRRNARRSLERIPGSREMISMEDRTWLKMA